MESLGACSSSGKGRPQCASYLNSSRLVRKRAPRHGASKVSNVTILDRRKNLYLRTDLTGSTGRQIAGTGIPGCGGSVSRDMGKCQNISHCNLNCDSCKVLHDVLR